MRPPPRPVFRASTSALTAAMRARMTGVSWYPGCPVPLDERLSYWGFDHAAHRGELIVNASAAADMPLAFGLLPSARFPIRQVRLAEDSAATTSAPWWPTTLPRSTVGWFPGTSVRSQHAYGLAVGINPFENPEIQDGKADPTAAAAGWIGHARARR